MEEQLYKNAEHLVRMAKANSNQLEARAFLVSLSKTNPWIEKIAGEELDTPAFVFELLRPAEVKYVIKHLAESCIEWIDNEAKKDENFIKAWAKWKEGLVINKKKSNLQYENPKDSFFNTIFQLQSSGKIKLDAGLLFYKKPNLLLLEEAKIRILLENPILTHSSMLVGKIHPIELSDAQIRIYNGIYCIYQMPLTTSNIAISMREVQDKISQSERSHSSVLQCIVFHQNKCLATTTIILEPEENLPISTVPLELKPLRITDTSNFEKIVRLETKDGYRKYKGEARFNLCKSRDASTLWSNRWDCNGEDFDLNLPISAHDACESHYLSFLAIGSERKTSCFLPSSHLIKKVSEMPPMVVSTNSNLMIGEPLNLSIPDYEKGLIYFYIDTKMEGGHSILESIALPKKPIDFAIFSKEAGGWKTNTLFGKLVESPLYAYDAQKDFTVSIYEKFHLGKNYLHAFYIDEKSQVHSTTKMFEVRSDIYIQPPPEVIESMKSVHEIWRPRLTDSENEMTVYSANKSSVVFEKFSLGTVLSLDDMIVRTAWNLWNYKMHCAEQTAARLFAWWVLSRYGYTNVLERSKFDFLYDTLRSCYEERQALFTIWPNTPPKILYNEKILPVLSVFLQMDLPISQFLKNVLNQMAEKSITSEAFNGIDKNLGKQVEQPSIVYLWSHLWKNPKALLPILESNMIGGFPNIGGIWDKSELMAYQFLMFAVRPELEIQPTKRKMVKNPLTVWDRLTNSLGITEYPESYEVMTKTEVENLSSVVNRIPATYQKQGGTNLFGSTSSTVAFLQALIALRSFGKKMVFGLEEYSPKIVNKKTNRSLAPRWNLENRWVVGRPNLLSVELPKQKLPNLVLSVNAPNNCYILSGQNRFISQNEHYIEIPLMGSGYAQIQLMPFAPGVASLEAKVSDMYSDAVSEAYVTTIDAKD
jgi:hypothetical protein